MPSINIHVIEKSFIYTCTYTHIHTSVYMIHSLQFGGVFFFFFIKWKMTSDVTPFCIVLRVSTSLLYLSRRSKSCTLSQPKHLNNDLSNTHIKFIIDTCWIPPAFNQATLSHLLIATTSSYPRPRSLQGMVAVFCSSTWTRSTFLNSDFLESLTLLTLTTVSRTLFQVSVSAYYPHTPSTLPNISPESSLPSNFQLKMVVLKKYTIKNHSFWLILSF